MRRSDLAMNHASLPALTVWDWAVIGGFFAATLGIGLYFARRARSSLADYFVAGRKMTWWVAGTSIVATSFAADTPLVISKWVRTSGLERNWFWWGGIMGMMLCTFFFARLWRRAKLLTDVEFIELRYSGAPAAGLRLFHASFRSLIQNTLVMGWVTLAMTKILDVTLDIPTIVFVKGRWLPELVAKGAELSSVIDMADVAHWPVLGEAIIPAKVTGIVLCFTVAATYSAVSGLWGVMATDLFQFVLAMIGTVVLMFVVFAVADGPRNMVARAANAVNSGDVHNQAPIDRQILEKSGLRDAVSNDGIIQKLTATDLFLVEDENQTLIWRAHGLDESQINTRLQQLEIDDELREAVIDLWKNAYTISEGAFTNSRVVEQLLGAGILIRDEPFDGRPLGYYRFPDVSLTEQAMLEQVNAAGIESKSEIMAAWRGDRVVASPKITGFLPPFDLKGGGLVAVWSLVVFLGLQWWGGGEGGGFLAQRLFSCKNEKHSVLAMLWFNFAHFVLRPWPWIVVGIGSLFLIPDVTAYGAHYDAEHAYVIMLMKYLPVGLKGLLVAALMAAYMSTISTHINFGASYVVNDLYKRFIHRGGRERSYVIVSQIFSILLAVLAGLYAFYSESIAEGWFTFFELMSGAGLATLLRWYWWRINAWSELAALTSSLTVFCLLNYTELFQTIFVAVGAPTYLLDEYSVRFTLNLVISTGVWVAVTFITPPERTEHLVRFYKRVRPAGWWKRIAATAGHPDHLTVGWREWACWFLGTTGLLAMILSLGQACFGNYASSACFAVYGILTIIFTFKLIGKMDWTSIAPEKQVPPAMQPLQ